MADRLIVRAPAKINLYLRVVGRRNDGYHEIETLFERIDLSDELMLEAQAAGVTLTGSEPRLSYGEENLVVKAARLLQASTGTSAGARLHLCKRIPLAAGLGGGSSDAAAALVGLNTLWQLGMAPGRLQELGARLGADVPFFLQPSAWAIGRGRGDQCEVVRSARRLVHVLVVPDAQLLTRDIYQASQFDLTAPQLSISIVAHALSNGSLGELAEGLWNDLEPEAIRRCPLIAQILLSLRQLGCLGARLSGSGPAVFGLCQDEVQARQVAEGLSRLMAETVRLEIVRTDVSHCGLPLTV